MNRLAIGCGIGLMLLTVAAFYDHVQSEPLPGQEPERTRPIDARPAGAGGMVEAPPTVAPESAPAVNMAALASSVETKVATPLREHRISMASFSRVALPHPHVELKMEDAPRPPREDGRVFAYFRVLESRTRFGQKRGEARQLTLGRVDVATGHVELAPGTATAAADHAFQDLASALKRLGVGRWKRDVPLGG